MAVHNDKISKKRRDLFKALSAVPVVSTLTPGSALAAQSSMQCAAKLREEFPDPPLGPVDAGSVTNPFIYAELRYWILTVADITDPNPKPGESGIKDLTGILIDPADLPLTIVEVVADAINWPDSPAGLYLLDGTSFDDLFTTGTYQVVGGQLQIFNGASPSKLVATLSALTGDFLVVARTKSIINEDGDEIPDGAIDTLGIYPEEEFPPNPKPGGPDPGDPQGISATCLSSFNDAATGGGGSRGLTSG